jgi:hypothetical protein
MVSSTVQPLTINGDLLKQTMGVTLVLSVKFLVCILFQGNARIQGGTRPPEDMKLFPKAGKQVCVFAAALFSCAEVIVLCGW